jgi:hypothetical protein
LRNNAHRKSQGTRKRHPRWDRSRTLKFA